MHKILIVGGWGRHFKLKSLTATALKLLDMLSISQISIDSGRGGNIWAGGGEAKNLEYSNTIEKASFESGKYSSFLEDWIYNKDYTEGVRILTYFVILNCCEASSEMLALTISSAKFY